MFKTSNAFSSFSVDDMAKAKAFYGETLGLHITEEEMGNIMLHINGKAKIMIYPKGKQHTPANFTVLNFLADDIEESVKQLKNRGVKFESYDGDIETDENGIHRGGGPLIAWFKDPSGNILSVIEEE